MPKRIRIVPDICDRDYWQPFLGSIARLIAHRKRGGHVTLVERDGKLYSQGGKGRGKLLYF